ncbi:MAG: NADH-quinone oxidoreductase subunit D [Chloroflexi bacterium]|nr:NADH-quinone oxidoreductase subunit D [Chloroflexota bacterium]
MSGIGEVTVGPFRPERPLDTVEMMLNMGPQHPSTHGVFRMVLWIDGERIVDVEPHIGYLHRGSEKLCEGEIYSEIITLFDRLDYVSNFNNELVFCMAVEKLAAIQVPERAQYIRLILCELNRIASHLLFYGTFGLDAGAMTPILYGFRDREKVQSLFEAVSGARLMHNYFRIGGVKQDLPADFRDRMTWLLGELRRGVDECDRLLTFGEVFLARTRDVGNIDAQTAIGLGLTGPNLRATGVPYDVRRADPYLVYDRLEFDIPVGDRGDCWDRYYVRVQEMRQSLRILEQALGQLPEGPIMAPVRRILRPPKGEVVAHAENPRGDFGVYLVSDGTDKPYRVKVRPPSFCHLMALKHLLRDCYVADCVMVLGSLDVVLGEVDR